MKLEEYLRFLASEIAAGSGRIICYDEISRWPKEWLPDLIAKGVLIETQPGNSIICDECEHSCDVEPTIMIGPNGKSVGVFYCREQGGRVDIDLERLRRWEIVPSKIHDLGYRAPVADEALTNEEVVALLGGGISVGTVTKWVKKGILKDNGRSGREHRVYKSSVLLYKQQIDNQKEIDDALEKARLEKAKKP